MYEAGVTARNFTGAATAWYKEVRDFPVANVVTGSWAGATGVVGHYTAVVWAKTKKVGCGVTSFRMPGRKTYKQVCLTKGGKQLLVVY